MSYFSNIFHTNRAVLIGIFLIGNLSLAQEPQISISSKVDKSLIHIGDLIQYTIIVTHDRDVRVEMPGLGANLGGFEIRDYDVEEPRKQDGLIVSEVNYAISTFFTGEFEIPPLTVLYYTKGDSTAKALSTEKIKIVVESIKPSEAGDILDIKPPVEIPRSLWYLMRWFVLGGGILILALIGFLIVWRKKQGKSILPVRPEIRRPPHEIAYEELDRLRQSDLLVEGEVKQYYTEISEIIRRYIEGRYFIIAMEMTTTEVLDGLMGADVTVEELHIFQHFLDQCDLVKFAKVIPSDGETTVVIQIASEIIDRTKVIITESDFEEKGGKTENEPGIEEAEKFDGSSDTEPVAIEMDEKNQESSESGGGYT